MNYNDLPDYNFQQPPVSLLERIMLAIKAEQEKRHSKKLVYGFCFLLIISLVATPLSVIIFSQQLQSSGILYFMATALSDWGALIALWPDFILAILESLPLISLTSLLISLAIACFTLRLFLYRKKLLLHYLTGHKLMAI